jgi:tetratricopeptide (TPR) repeat protein
MKLVSLLAAACLATACASAPPPAPPAPSLFNDAAFKPTAERIDAREVFAVDEAMRRYVHEEIGRELEKHGRQKGLFEALYTRNRLKLEYDAAITRTAAQAFAARQGNCLSLVIMTAALARELGLEVRFQRVIADDMWSRSGELYFVSSHVNVQLAGSRADPMRRVDERQLFTIDFMPPKPRAITHTRELTDENIISMFMNNRAAESLAAGRIDDAYWWAREAILQDPKYLSALNTLGVVYKKKGAYREAERAFSRLLEREPGNIHAMSNLAIAYKDQGRFAEAKALEDRVAALQPQAPFYFFDRGLLAMEAGEFQVARTLFLREVERDAYYHEFHFGVAVASLWLGDVETARRHLAIALENSPTRGDRAIYAGKLAKLRKKEKDD